MTITLHWWLVPVVLFALGAMFLRIATKSNGYFGGIFEVMLGIGLWFAAAISALTGWVVQP